MKNLRYIPIKDINKASGTALQGYLRAKYSDVERVFGKPTHLGSGDDKVQARWVLMFEDEEIATIYDYKEDLNYKKVYMWHIGGHKPDVVKRINKIFKDAQK